MSPSAALLVHQAARAVDRIDEQPPAAVLLACSAWQHERFGQSLRDHAHRLASGQCTQAVSERFLADTVDRVDRVAHVARFDRQLLLGLSLTRLDHGAPDRIMQRQQRFEQPLCAGAVTCHRRPLVLRRPVCSARSRPPAAPQPFPRVPYR